MDIQTLEHAADVFLAGPKALGDQDYKMADEMFQNLKNSNLEVSILLQALHQTAHHFVQYQLSQAVAESILHRWVILSPEEIQASYKALLDYIANNEALNDYVIREMLRTVAITIKRGTLDEKAGTSDQLCQVVREMITNQNPRTLSNGCQLILAVTEQFSSAWRSSHLSITWDFHMKAKTSFEKGSLKDFFQMALEMLSLLCGQVDILGNDFYRRLCDKFLGVAEIIFQWNFAARVFRRFFATTTQANAFRPPVSWSDIVTKDEFIDLFFRLHSLIRLDVDLALKSMTCLSQLASFSGEIMTSNPDFSQEYVQHFLGNVVQIFKDGTLTHETNGLCVMIHRCFVFRPIHNIARLPTEFRREFFSFFAHYLNLMIKQAMTNAIGENEHADLTSLCPLLDAWCQMLRGRWRGGLSEQEQAEIEDSILHPHTMDVVNSFIVSVQAPPFGTRPPSSTEDRNEDDEEDDDRLVFKAVLHNFHQMATYTVSSFVPSASQLIHAKVEELKAIMSTTIDMTKLHDWQEDMHWLMLFVANSVTSEDIDGTCVLAGEIFDASNDMVEGRGALFSEEVKVAYLLQCINSPTADRPVSSPDLDPFIVLLGEILAWNVLENQMIMDENTRRVVSPELTRSSIHCLKRFIYSASNIPDDLPDTRQPLLYPNEQLSEALVQFVLQKVFHIMQLFSGEYRLCVDAVALLASLIDSRAEFLSRGDQLYNFLANIDLSRLPARTKLMHALVLIAAQAGNEEVQQGMYHRIVVPMMDRFRELIQQPSNSQSDSEIADLLQCFIGVALAGNANTSCVLIEFLNPLLTQCVPVMKTHAHSQPIITSILELMVDVTTKVIIYVDDREKGLELYRALMGIVEGYATHQMNRFSKMTQVEEDEKATDLVLFMDILSNVLSKDILEGGPNNVTAGAQCVMSSLDMLLTVMNENILKIPDVCNKFYRIIVYLVEFSPETLQVMSGQLIHSIFQMIRIGMDSTFGQDICTLALEILTEITAYMIKNPHLQNPVITENIQNMIRPTFECCLDYCCENALFTDATGALHVLICFSKTHFENFVAELLSHRNNQDTADRLRVAFATLLPTQVNVHRTARLDFRRRMEEMLNEIQGLLTLP